jgi:3-methyladenine DNA glycosylase AlkD
MATSKLLSEIRKELKKAAVPAKAPEMQAYMKSKMPYHGVQTPMRRLICKQIFKNLEFKNAKAWEQEVRAIWEGARFREERYCALQLCSHKCAEDFQTPKALKLYEGLIVEGAWWDYVDTLAADRVGGLLESHPAEIKPLMLQWSRSPDVWKRRTSIISQLGFGHETDLKLLYACIEPSLGSKEFFLQKAIGWALRQYAWKDPKEVKHYVAQNEDRLAPLSRREALKNLNR